MIISVPAVTISNQTRTIGPAVVTQTWNRVDSVLTVGTITAPLLVAVQTSPDGVAWQSILTLDIVDVGRDRNTGLPLPSATFSVAFPDSLFSSGARIRLQLQCTGTFQITGGTVTVT